MIERNRYASLGSAIRALRKQQARTLMETAGPAGISMSFLSQIERGQATPSLGALYRICGALDVSLKQLLDAASDAPMEGAAD